METKLYPSGSEAGENATLTGTLALLKVYRWDRYAHGAHGHRA